MCNHDCFNCEYPDCICDDVSREEKTLSEKIDAFAANKNFVAIMKKRECGKKDYKKHRDKRLSYSKNYYIKNKDRISAYKKEWYRKKKKEVAV